HCHHLVVNGEKMSKSKGNFFTLRDLLARQIDPVDLRYFLLSTHYRKMLNFTFDNLDQARAARQRIIDFVYELEHQPLPPKGENQGDAISTLTDKALADFKASLADDLNISSALAAVFELIREINSKLARNEISRPGADRVLTAIYEIDQVLAILPEKKEEELPADVLRKIEQREQARREKNFALADSIRQELLQQGIVLEDTREGVRWKKTK
ncbi:MAG TPA: class I tRNA ligase family protein, partial [Candidatus Saccharicenans sp.]|nr:class I tRNA ligase family protein [Candidatus Saccharicenans sp.]